MVHAGKTELQVHIMFWTNTAWCNVTSLCTTPELRFLLPHQTNSKVKGYNITKSCKPFWNAKCYEFYIYRWIYSQHNYPKYMQLRKQKWNKYHNYIYHWTWQILIPIVFHSTHVVHKFENKLSLNFKINWNDITIKATHTHTHTLKLTTHTHTHISDKIFTVKISTKVTTINISNIT